MIHLINTRNLVFKVSASVFVGIKESYKDHTANFIYCNDINGDTQVFEIIHTDAEFIEQRCDIIKEAEMIYSAQLENITTNLLVDKRLKKLNRLYKTVIDAIKNDDLRNCTDTIKHMNLLSDFNIR